MYSATDVGTASSEGAGASLDTMGAGAMNSPTMQTKPTSQVLVRRTRPLVPARRSQLELVPRMIWQVSARRTRPLLLSRRTRPRMLVLRAHLQLVPRMSRQAPARCTQPLAPVHRTRPHVLSCRRTVRPDLSWNDPVSHSWRSTADGTGSQSFGH